MADVITNLNRKMITPPISMLLIGPEENCRSYIDDIIQNLKINRADLKEIAPEDSKGKTRITSIDQVRLAQRFISLTPLGNYKVLVFSDAASLNPQAANALLKTLEEPPHYGINILCAQRDNLLPTITSRCRMINLWEEKASGRDEYDFDEILKMPFYAQSELADKVAKTQSGKSFLEAFERWARAKLVENKKSNEVRLIKEIIRAKRDIKGNVSARVVLESLLMRYIHNV